MSRVYFHIDLNAFFANAEVLLDPSLKGKPIAVSGQTRRSVVATASYEARKYGVHSAMPIGEAMRLCPDLIVVEPHFHWYRSLSQQFITIVESYTKEIEQASIDECYADMTEPILRMRKPLDLAWQLQHRILEELHLPCSIGIGPNMFLAKMGSDRKKPMGITVMRLREVPEKLWPLDIREMRGIGQRTLPYMEELNIKTIGDLAHYEDIQALRPIFGKNTERMIARANGRDDRTIIKEYDAKSMGVSETLLEDVTDEEEIRGLFRTLARRLSRRLEQEKKAGSLVSVRIKYYDFSNVDRSCQTAHPIWKTEDLFENAVHLFEDNWEGEPVRLLGISLADFAEDSWLRRQINLFDSQENAREETEAVLQDLNQQLSLGGRLVRASSILEDKS